MADYVNPFGGWASGYTQGADLEDRLQQNTRAAREEDWKHQYLDPDTATRSHVQTREDQAKEPYYDSALNDASVQSRAGAATSALDAAQKYAVATRDSSGVDTAARYFLGPNYQSPGATTELRGADFGNNLQVFGAQAKAADEAAQETQRRADASFLANENEARIRAAQLRAGPPAASAPSPVNRLFPSAPATPAAVPTAPAVDPGATPPASSEAAPSDQGDGVAAITPFHQLHPVAQAHVIHYASQLTGHPPEAIAAHIAQANPEHYSDPYNPGQADNPNDAASYYAKPTSNFATA